jgi:hypothetical protein
VIVTFALPLIVVCAVGAWMVAVYSAIAVVRLAPPGQRLSAYFNLGWWRFAKVRSAIGPAADPHINRFRYAFYVYLAVIAAIVAALAALVALT